MNYKSLAKLFTSSDIARVAQGDLSTVVELQKKFPTLNHTRDLTEVYEQAYKLLAKHYRNEYIIKNTIANNILLGRHSLNTATMLSELRIGTNKADCVILNGSSTCYEIKTEFDSLSRLPEQLAAYTRAFDKTYVVAHKKHLNALEAMPEESFGIIQATEQGRLSIKRPAPKNFEFDLDLMFGTLRREEYLAIAREHLGSVPDLPNTQIFNFCKEAFMEMDSGLANEKFKENLKKFRKNDHKFVHLLPKPLKNVGISYQINNSYKSNFIDMLLSNIAKDRGDTNVLSLYERQKA